ncbi:hypothetical protein [Lysinibacillus sp. NPDC059133]|uniref:hypothetical protein n=1 Tax=Lysinibacillus sp. NPDC059133 TaxID=3346737 RepID=UPI0036AD0766
MLFISFILFYVVGIPLSVLLHEIGHALGVILFSKEKVYIYLGTSDSTNKENFRIGRMHFHLGWAYYGYCRLVKECALTRVQTIALLLGGPVMSLCLAVLTIIAVNMFTNDALQNFLNGCFYVNGALFLLTAIPIIYPKWLKPYAGLPSDGYQIIRVLKNAKI